VPRPPGRGPRRRSPAAAGGCRRAGGARRARRAEPGPAGPPLAVGRPGLVPRRAAAPRAVRRGLSPDEDTAAGPSQVTLGEARSTADRAAPAGRAVVVL